MRKELIREYLKNKLNNSWYYNAKLDYGVDGHFIKCEFLSDTVMEVTWEEMGEEKALEINYYLDYTNEQLYNIWMEFGR